MPTYDYFCETNSRTVEVSHKMSELLSTWGELCDKASIEPGDTPLDAPVKKLLSGPAVISGASRNEAPPCASGGCCPGGSCGLE
ncbi:FmdB family zinc ribbon protein [Candidatus Endoriftia persephonae]|jgi:predicted nucleic acid-binding Zn ribbon protein|uniref:Zinc ribbon domain-containing protein n=4 Tax=Gammaproteobacteria TaxID=1236 RepID=G2FAY9_9GAMM|nr:hypothetical protein [Candidatus Endoriftia persephone]EGV52801.1 hypothetical protein Rifp1Sym_ab00270 [endosymbiont of Riftia pachyptila (vent Ph05)]EGW55927.1 hypothetical protein TevJSym_aa00710 [endosymbiont of Tevnia jerichonana (vent Tica)]KRT55202.1 hypothetical protein Ga0074115_11525 [endosymbiont of Ridgeia piscesae]KRT57467.1 hypothetical protein Ga0076813_11617 [endosymbiont of Ridgeia piscesae]USF88063.1 zinc ribbon domain-containing protein [Candidatus Endoriftia persephone]